jgi:hypothetical protein
MVHGDETHSSGVIGYCWPPGVGSFSLICGVRAPAKPAAAACFTRGVTLLLSCMSRAICCTSGPGVLQSDAAGPALRLASSAAPCLSSCSAFRAVGVPGIRVSAQDTHNHAEASSVQHPKHAISCCQRCARWDPALRGGYLLQVAG